MIHLMMIIWMVYLKNVNIVTKLDLVNYNVLISLEEISTQNGPPKKNNKIIVKVISIDFGGRKEKNYFFVRIFEISSYDFTQISIRRARWMRN